MTDRSIAYGNFTVTRTFPAAVERVWRAWSDPVAKAKWFGVPGEPLQVFEFKVGGREFMQSQHGGTSFTFDVRYQDIVEFERIIYTYDMTMNGQRISVSLASVELQPDGTGTKMTVVEHGAFLDGLDTNAQREEGTNALMDALGRSLAD